LHQRAQQTVAESKASVDRARAVLAEAQAFLRRLVQSD
jgi:hypothetical protein